MEVILFSETYLELYGEFGRPNWLNTVAEIILEQQINRILCPKPVISSEPD